MRTYTIPVSILQLNSNIPHWDDVDKLHNINRTRTNCRLIVCLIKCYQEVSPKNQKLSLILIDFLNKLGIFPVLIMSVLLLRGEVWKSGNSISTYREQHRAVHKYIHTYTNMYSTHERFCTIMEFCSSYSDNLRGNGEQQWKMQQMAESYVAIEMLNLC